MKRTTFFNRNALTILLVLAAYLVGIPAGVAQYQLHLGEAKTINALTSSDLVIPSGVHGLTLTLKGGDGGDAHLKGISCDTRIKGGAGAVIKASFPVGSRADYLRPGGRLRVFVGMTGHTDNKLCTPNPTGVYGGGGGSSAILYQPPGLDPVTGIWDLLVVAGAGGGGARPSAGIFHRGKGGNARPNGDAAKGYTVLEGNDESTNGACGFSIGGGEGAAGVACQTSDDSSIGSANMTLELIDKIAATQIVLKPNSAAYTTGGNDTGAPGGNGFTGGSGVYKAAAGAGGGYSGGGGGSSGKNGGGGGSFVSSKYFNLYSQKNDGADGEGSESNGYVTITVADVLPIETVYAATQNVNLLQSGNFKLVWQQDGNLVLKEKDGSGKYTTRWSSNTANQGDQFNFQEDGNLVIYNGSKQPIWSTDTWGNTDLGRKSGYSLLLNPQGELSIVSIDHITLWTARDPSEGSGEISNSSSYFQLLPGSARDVAAGNDGSLWKISNESTDGGCKIYKYNGTDWELKNGGGVRIAVAFSGVPWLVNEDGDIFRANDADATGWTKLPGSAHDIAVDNNGRPWVIGTIPVAGGYSIHYWDGSQWHQVSGGAVRIGAGDVPWVVNDSDQIYRLTNGYWQREPGQGTDIGVSRQGQAYLVGDSNIIYRRVGVAWEPMQVTGSSVSVGSKALVGGTSKTYGLLKL